jgi:hypothetical protein
MSNPELLLAMIASGGDASDAGASDAFLIS